MQKFGHGEIENDSRWFHVCIEYNFEIVSGLTFKYLIAILKYDYTDDG